MLRATQCKAAIPSYADVLASVSVEETFRMLADLRDPIFAFKLPTNNVLLPSHLRFTRVVADHGVWTLVLYAVNEKGEYAAVLCITPRSEGKEINYEPYVPSECMRVINADTLSPLKASEKMPSSVRVLMRGCDFTVYLGSEAKC
jgi:hypothetical protein